MTGDSTAGQLDPWDKALLSALEQPSPGGLLSLEELAQAANLSPALLEVVVREGFLTPVRGQPEPLYELSAADSLKAGLELVEAGLPLGELLDLARRTDRAMRPIAEQAVDVFARFVRDSVEANAQSDEEAVARLVSAFTTMLPATGRLIDYHFRRLLVEGARKRLAGGE
ncbi:MAG: hypothetical protein ACRDWH_03520 [Acidimicrobiia bacterium]